MTNKENEKLIKGVYDGLITELELPEFLFLYTFSELQKEVDKGYGSIKKLKGAKQKKAANFRTNINVFSGAKTYQEVKDLSQAVFMPDGQRMPFSDFKKVANAINDTYNKAWLKAEQNMALQQSISAKEWDNIEETKDIFPLLKYMTVGDAQVRPEHAEWDGIIRPVDDSFWNTRMPPNDWGCRCEVEQLEEGVISSLKGKPQNDSKLFANNPGKDEFIFDPSEHPYFKNITRDKSNNLGFGFE